MAGSPVRMRGGVGGKRAACADGLGEVKEYLARLVGHEHVNELPRPFVALHDVGIGKARGGEVALDPQRERGYDTVRIAVMSCNEITQSFYTAVGYSVAEHVLLRRLDP